MNTIKESTYDDEKQIAYLSGAQEVRGFHRSDECAGEVCPVHKPSNHAYRHLPLKFDMRLFSFIRVLQEDSTGVGYVVDPDDYNLNRYGKVIARNAIFCLLCEEEIESLYRHDYRECPCQAVAVDGGHEYQRIIGHPDDYEDRSVVFVKGAY